MKKNRVLRSLLCLACFWAAEVFSLELRGDFVQGGMVIGRADPGSKVMLGDRALPVSAAGLFVFGFDRDAGPGELLRVESSTGEVTTRELQIEARQYDIQHIEGIPKKIMAPSGENRRRAKEEAQQVWQARSGLSERQDYAKSFQWPLTGPITGVFGSQRVYNGEPRRPHYGVDVAAPMGTPVSVPVSGKVLLAHPDMFYSGGTIIIDHGHGVSSTLIHLSRVLVKPGDEVRPGDIVGEVGAGGRATGPHLDWRMNWLDRRLDPQLLVGAMPEQGEGSEVVGDR
jgi:murein DD-endopeptidase MepM/ murein hydrolase activator NlpD